MRTYFFSILLLISLAGCSPEDSPDTSGNSTSWAAASASGSGTLTALYVPAEGFAWQNGGHLTLEYGEPIIRHPIGDDAAEEFGYILPKGSDWTPLFEDFFRHDGGFTNSETYRLILEEHLGEGLTELLLRS